MMKTQAILPLLFLVACGEPGPRFADCTPEQEADGRRAYVIAVKTFPEAEETFDRIRVSCSLFDPYPGSECVTWIYPNDTGEGLMEGRIDLIGECVLHEAQHWALVAKGVKKGCQSHLPDCGWDKYKLEDGLDKYHTQK